MNPIFWTDSYKYTHWKQLPPNTTGMFYYLSARGNDDGFDEIVPFGLQAMIKDKLLKPFTYNDVMEAQAWCADHFQNSHYFNTHGHLQVLRKHGGFWPVRIRAVPEGMIVPNHNVMLTVETTDPELAWIDLETLLVQLWYPTTVATLSREMKKLILKALKISGEPGLIDFKLHDFGCRGVSSMESARIGGAAHLVNFKGTDTVPGVDFAREFYGEPMAGYSIAAAQHSTITSWGKEHEFDGAYRNMLIQFPTGPVAVVSDSFNIFDACSIGWGAVLKAEVLERDGVLIVRPDSGTPHEVVPKVLEILGAKFGFTTNFKFYKVLNPHVRVIQGDGIDYEETKRIIGETLKARWSWDNVALGMGGGLLQKVHRDTFNFKLSCSSVTVDGKEIQTYKEPVGSSMKASKRGRLKLVNESRGQDPSELRTVPESAPGKDLLQTVYEPGELVREQTFAEIRERAQVR